MKYNTCNNCGADGGRAGNCFGQVGFEHKECRNCADTRRYNQVIIHTNLRRTEAELNLTMAILEPGTPQSRNPYE